MRDPRRTKWTWKTKDSMKGKIMDQLVKNVVSSFLRKVRLLSTPVQVIIGVNVAVFISFKIATWRSTERYAVLGHPHGGQALRGGRRLGNARGAGVDLTAAAERMVKIVTAAAERMKGIQDEHMVLSERNIQKSGYHCLVTSMFMHKEPLHLFHNMNSLINVTLGLTHVLNPSQVVGVYLITGLAGGAAHLAYTKWAPHANIPASRFVSVGAGAIGASGAIMGLFGFLCARCPEQLIDFYGVPISLLLQCAGDAAWAAYNMYQGDSADRKIGHAAHIGGLLLGFTLGGMSAPRQSASVAQFLRANMRK